MSPSPNDRRLIGLGILAGAVVGAVVVAGRAKPVVHNGAPTLIDWDRVLRVATGMNRADSTVGSDVGARQRYVEQVARCVPLITDFTGQSLPRALDTVYVFDRNAWIRANIAN